jgi:hypothetical protein
MRGGRIHYPSLVYFFHTYYWGGEQLPVSLWLLAVDVQHSRQYVERHRSEYRRKAHEICNALISRE